MLSHVNVKTKFTVYHHISCISKTHLKNQPLTPHNTSKPQRYRELRSQTHRLNGMAKVRGISPQWCWLLFVRQNLPRRSWQLAVQSGEVLLMEEIVHHLGCIKPCKSWDKLPINWCRISSINSRDIIYLAMVVICIYIYIYSLEV